MAAAESVQFRLMTYNVGAARKHGESVMADVVEVIRSAAPDIVALQETIRWTEADGSEHALAGDLARELGARGWHHAPTLVLTKHFHPKKKAFVDAREAGYREWSQGNGLLLPSPTENAEVVSLFEVPYEGDRDTDPRNAVIATASRSGLRTRVAGTHLSTLNNERGASELPGRAERAQARRRDEVKKLLEALSPSAAGDPIFLLGDFNATADEACLRDLVGAGFVYLKPRRPIATHPKVDEPIDHIFVAPAARVVRYECEVIDTPLTRRASDHKPVLADVWLSRAAAMK